MENSTLMIVWYFETLLITKCDLVWFLTRMVSMKIIHINFSLHQQDINAIILCHQTEGVDDCCEEHCQTQTSETSVIRGVDADVGPGSSSSLVRWVGLSKDDILTNYQIFSSLVRVQSWCDQWSMGSESLQLEGGTQSILIWSSMINH